MINLGTPEKPVRVTYDLITNYRWIYVKVDYTQHSLIEALESRELDRRSTNLRVTQGTNLGTASASCGSRPSRESWRAAT